MIKELTGGDICYGHDVNTIGLLIAGVAIIIIWEIFITIIVRMR